MGTSKGAIANEEGPSDGLTYNSSANLKEEKE